MNDLQLIEGCREGDRRAQEELYRTYSPMLFGICLRYASGREEAEDFLQDAFIKIFGNLYQYQPTGPFSAWIRKVTVNVILQNLRKRRMRFPPIEIGELADTYGSDEDLFSNFRAKALLTMVQQLPDGYRAVFNLYVIEGYAHKEISEQLGFSEATSKSQLSRAKAYLRKMLERVV